MVEPFRQLEDCLCINPRNLWWGCFFSSVSRLPTSVFGLPSSVSLHFLIKQQYPTQPIASLHQSYPTPDPVSQLADCLCGDPWNLWWGWFFSSVFRLPTSVFGLLFPFIFTLTYDAQRNALLPYANPTHHLNWHINSLPNWQIINLFSLHIKKTGHFIPTFKTLSSISR